MVIIPAPSFELNTLLIGLNGVSVILGYAFVEESKKSPAKSNLVAKSFAGFLFLATAGTFLVLNLFS